MTDRGRSPEMDRARAERALEIGRRIEAGEPLRSIFPRKVWTPPVEVVVTPDGRADFLWSDAVVEGARLRRFVYSCDHGTQTLDLNDPIPDETVVLAHMVTTMRRHVAETGGLCLCRPGGHTAPAS